ncbi:unnamed protein product [Anisakis simplex]|uniref:Inner membrane protein n=1 Tax=Anisakis simplex TaxID=6269 RepID=A0A0M3J7J4_ANISI|nr:unnamed protein product [Anisakis simplex]
MILPCFFVAAAPALLTAKATWTARRIAVIIPNAVFFIALKKAIVWTLDVAITLLDGVAFGWIAKKGMENGKYL